MLRFYRDFIEQVLMVLIYHRNFTGDSLETISKRILDSTMKDSFTVDIMERTRERVISTKDSGEPAPTIDGLIDELTNSLKAIDNGVAKDGDLIDIIVKVLQLPYARSIMSGKMLENIRKALLLPAEIASLAAIKEKEFSCAGCNHKFIEQELVTTYKTDGSTNTVLYCTNCMRPRFTACNKCEEGASEIEGALYKALKKARFDCGKHSDATKEVDKSVIEAAPIFVATEPLLGINVGRTLTFEDNYRVAVQRDARTVGRQDLRQDARTAWQTFRGGVRGGRAAEPIAVGENLHQAAELYRRGMQYQPLATYDLETLNRPQPEPTPTLTIGPDQHLLVTQGPNGENVIQLQDNQPATVPEPEPVEYYYEEDGDE